MTRLLFAVVAIIALCTVIVGCGGTGTSNDHAAHDGHDHADEAMKFTYEGSGPVRITTTTGMIADAIRNVGGSRVQVQSLMGPGVDPHLYKATPGDIRKLNDADIVFYNGLHLEGKMADILQKLNAKKPTVAVASQLPKDELLAKAGAAGFADPHIWFDVEKWSRAVEEARDQLSTFDAAGKAEYEKNAAKYLNELKKLDAYATEQIATIPEAQRVLVTAHDAFGYFGKAYAIDVQGLQGISTASEASLKDVQRIVKLLVDRKIKAVFVESSVPRRNIEAVVQGARARGHNVVIGGQLFSDAMGAEGTPQGTYVGMVRHNVDTIVKALK